MTKIDYHDFQYERENFYFERIEPVFRKLLKDQPDLNNKVSLQQHEFYRLISRAVQVDEHYVIRNITRQINRQLKSNFNIKIFVFQADRFETHCTPYIDNKRKNKELIILVSQHFFNSLGEYERVCVIAHELSHLLYGHMKIPLRILLNIPLPIEDEFKMDLLKWSLSREITADAFSLIASDFNHAILSRSLIKYETGLNNVFGDDMITMALNQYNLIADINHQEQVSTHPIMPLRIKLINSIIDTELAHNFGKDVSIGKKKKYIKEYNAIIDNVVNKVYPEVINLNYFRNDQILFNMAVAVILSDEEITPQELKAIGDITVKKFNPQKEFEKIKKKVKELGYKKIINQLITESIVEAKKKSKTKNDLSPLIRQLLLIAASDKIELVELETINKFGKEFGFKRLDIILMLSSMGLSSPPPG